MYQCLYILHMFTCFFFFSVNTKVDMRFNVKNAYWLSERIREKILQTVCFFTILWPRVLFLIMFHLVSKDSCVQVVWCLELILTGEESDQQGRRTCDIFNQNQDAEVSNLIIFFLFHFSSKQSHFLTLFFFTQRQHRRCTCKATGKLSNLNVAIFGSCIMRGVLV